MKDNEKLVETTPEIKKIRIVDGVVVKCEGGKLCFPEPEFEMIERCKLCGKWI